VIGTSNKTESLLGYTTQFGDNASAIQPIGDLYKNQVRQLSRAVGVPQVIVDKAPSADLWPGQTDENELGYTYDDADQLLYLLVDRRYKPEEAVSAGFDPVFVDGLWKRVQQMHYKRHLPVIAKLSQRTMGYDFLYMRDWGT
jgi:NAD+ synthase